MSEDLIGEYGTLCPLTVDQIIELSRDVDAFEEMTDFTLAPYLLNVDFLDRLDHKVMSFRDQSEEAQDWDTLWAMVHQSDTIVGFWDFTSAPSNYGCVVLHWVLNPEWECDPFEREALRSLVDWAFSRNECRSITVVPEYTGAGKVDTLRRLGFRDDRRDDGVVSFRLVKTVEGQLL